MIKIGLDVGSTTIKYVVLDDENTIIYKDYQRHYSQITEKIKEICNVLYTKFPTEEVTFQISGSAAMGIATDLGIPFVQEVYATRLAVKTYLPDTDVVIELGGEDAKIIFISGIMEVRMNGTCAGGTGAFVDQISTLLKSTPLQMNELAKDSDKIYTIASRCGVFAKSDIQPLLNQGAKKEDISASVFQAVVNQTIAGLSQGRKILGNIVYLGGPLTFFSQLRKQFDSTLNLTGTLPEDSLYYVSIGSAISHTNKVFKLSNLVESLNNYKTNDSYNSCLPLFKNKQEYDEFAIRHKIGQKFELAEFTDISYIGIDAGSTTLKFLVMNENEEITYAKYASNGGNPVILVKQFLLELYELYPNIKIGGFATTGYGENIVKNAFGADFGIVETIAHFTAAKKYDPNVDFIIDIGGQDIKCFKVKNGVIENIFLNEACSSGCGSFLQTFAEALGTNILDFAKIGLFADKPVELGSRCTVFMNSSVKQAQKDGASIENISAGLSMSVVKNALYKVIRITNAEDLGKNIVVQGGTFLNDAVLRSFEKELNREVTRPQNAELMGAYGCALYAKHNITKPSKIISNDKLLNFSHKVTEVVCNGCQNHCRLTINSFTDSKKFISGNKCDKPLNKKDRLEEFNMVTEKRNLLKKYQSFTGLRETIGIPLVLNMYETLPFWHTFFKELGFGVKVTSESTRDTFIKGQDSIPSDTICYPAKLVHGHIRSLMEDSVDAIFYPCMSYNFIYKKSDNNYNCPVVAYYPEVIDANMEEVKDTVFIKDYIGLHDKKIFPKKMFDILPRYFKNITLKQINNAAKKAYHEYDVYMSNIGAIGEEFLSIAEKTNRPVIVLAGRPYHIDEEINHKIDKLICEMGAILVTEDGVCDLINEKVYTSTLNQWTYHSRLYSAAKYVSEKKANVNLVQLVSFGCGIDAITTDAVRRILESKNKIYTQIKIDEISNLGAVKIRLRSLFSAIEIEDK